LFEAIIFFFEILTETEIPVMEDYAISRVLQDPNITSLFSRYAKLDIKDPKFAPKLEEQVRVLYSWWYNKRQTLNKPLLRIFWPQTQVSDQNPELVFRARERERYKLRKKKNNDVDQYLRLLQQQKDLDCAIILGELVKSREEINLTKNSLSLAKMNDSLGAAGDTAKISKEVKKVGNVPLDSLKSQFSALLFFQDRARKAISLAGVEKPLNRDSITSEDKNITHKAALKLDQGLKKVHGAERRRGRMKKQPQQRARSNSALAADFIKVLEGYTPRSQARRSMRSHLATVTEEAPKEEIKVVPPPQFLIEHLFRDTSVVKPKPGIDRLDQIVEKSELPILHKDKKRRVDELLSELDFGREECYAEFSDSEDILRTDVHKLFEGGFEAKHTPNFVLWH